jgi:hypothetical protein
MRTLLGLTAVLLMAGSAWAADESDTQNSTIGGTIPELCQIGIAGNLTALLTLTQDGNGETDYDTGYVESTPNATILTLDANKTWALGVNYTGPWSCPGAYNKAETDLLIRVTNTPTGTIENSFDSYQSPGGAKATMLDHPTGVSNNLVNIQTRVLLDWTKDIPGAYSITLVYTMETTP